MPPAQCNREHPSRTICGGARIQPKLAHSRVESRLLLPFLPRLVRGDQLHAPRFSLMIRSKTRMCHRRRSGYVFFGKFYVFFCFGTTSTHTKSLSRPEQKRSKREEAGLSGLSVQKGSFGCHGVLDKSCRRGTVLYVMGGAPPIHGDLAMLWLRSLTTPMLLRAARVCREWHTLVDDGLHSAVN